MKNRTAAKGKGMGWLKTTKKIVAVSKGLGVPTKAVWMGKVSFLVAEFCRSLQRLKKTNVVFRQKKSEFQTQTFYFIFKLLIKTMKI